MSFVKAVPSSPIDLRNTDNSTRVTARSRPRVRSPRAQFYSALMRTLGGSTGDELGAAFAGGDTEKFKALMDKLCTDLCALTVKPLSGSKREST